MSDDRVLLIGSVLDLTNDDRELLRGTKLLRTKPGLFRRKAQKFSASKGGGADLGQRRN
jgi:hypothetical protein